MEKEARTEGACSATFCNMTLRPVGIIRNGIKEPVLAAGGDGLRMRGQPDVIRTKIREMSRVISEIVIRLVPQ